MPGLECRNKFYIDTSPDVVDARVLGLQVYQALSNFRISCVYMTLLKFLSTRQFSIVLSCYEKPANTATAIGQLLKVHPHKCTKIMSAD